MQQRPPEFSRVNQRKREAGWRRNIGCAGRQLEQGSAIKPVEKYKMST